MGVAIQNVANHLGNLLSGRWKGRPFPLVGTAHGSGMQGQSAFHGGYGCTREGPAFFQCGTLQDSLFGLKGSRMVVGLILMISSLPIEAICLPSPARTSGTLLEPTGTLS